MDEQKARVGRREVQKWGLRWGSFHLQTSVSCRAWAQFRRSGSVDLVGLEVEGPPSKMALKSLAIMTLDVENRAILVQMW